MEKLDHSSSSTLTRSLSAGGAWAFSVGTSIGWGALVVTNNAYLKQGGPVGSVLGITAAALIMLVICRNYAYLMNAYPEAGGAYIYSREEFGYDHGFLTSWFLTLTYFAMLWANATSLPLFARYFLGNVFRVGKMYTLFGYDVYFGEALLSIAAVAVIAFLCACRKRGMEGMMLGMAVFLIAGIFLCFVTAFIRKGQPVTPSFIPEKSAFSQIIKIASISPWAFIGFESISHSVEEFSFRKTRIFRILVISIAVTTLLYVMVMLLSVTAYPPEYASWLDYMKDLDHLEGIKGLPAFYAAEHYLGPFGVPVLMISLLCLIFTSLIGNITALSRLFYSLGRDHILPARLGRVNKYGVPGMGIAFAAGISFLIPFAGRTAIGWIVDVTTLGATLIYGYVSAAAMHLARKRSDRTEFVTGTFGLVIAVFFGLYTLLPNLFTTGAMATESYFLFVIWGVLGFIYFRIILGKDQSKHFGRSIVVWIALLSLVLFVALVWMSQSIMVATDKGMQYVEEFYTGAGMTSAQAGIVASQMQIVRQTSAVSILVVLALFGLSLGILLNNYSLMNRRAMLTEEQLGLMREMANKDPLTGVKSKHAFAEKEKQINEQIQEGRMEAFSLAVCDVNGLKYINDTYGHKAGDEHIRKACHMICTFFDHSPVYRTGGDEFVVILTGDDYQNRKTILKSLHSASSEHIGSGEAVVAAGMADYIPEKSSSLHSIFEQADARMYENKKELKAKGAVSR